MLEHLQAAKKNINLAIDEVALETEDIDRKKTPLRALYRIPEIVETDITVKTRGNYQTKTKTAEGLIVHYTAGRSKNSTDAINTLRYLASQGLACPVVDIGGKIFKAKNQDWDDWGSHAGRSSHKDREWVSRYYYGLEFACAGLLDSHNKSWFGVTYAGEFVRVIDREIGNHKPGHWLKFTRAQVRTLINFCLWQLDTNPGFEIGNILGHDEVAPGRKSDPGGSLNWPMSGFRNIILEIVEGKRVALTDQNQMIWEAGK